MIVLLVQDLFFS